MSSSEREPKRLRSSEPDLQVILGSGNDTSTHWCHSQSIALKSKYVDAMLSTPMREQETRTITFPDISLSLWNKNKFLDDPSAARKMTVEDVQNVAMLYDKYEFKLGCKLCDDVLLEYFGSLHELEKSYKLDLDLIIDLTVMAHEANLASAFKEGMGFLLKKMTTYWMNPLLDACNRVMFTEERIEQIFPLMKHCTFTNDNMREMRSWVNGENMPVEHLNNLMSREIFSPRVVIFIT